MYRKLLKVKDFTDFQYYDDMIYVFLIPTCSIIIEILKMGIFIAANDNCTKSGKICFFNLF